MRKCRHFSECGGCRYQDIPYRRQLRDKKNKLKELLNSSGLSAKLKPINHAKKWYYRNKMEFSFSGQDQIVCGLYSKKVKRRLVDIKECLIFSYDAPAILKAVKNFAKEHNYSIYDKYSYQGFLRHLIVRETKFTKQLMVGLVTTSQQEFEAEKFVKNLKALKLKSEIKSIFRIVNDSWSDAVVFEKKELIYGRSFIQEKLGGLRFKIGIDTFFQVNPRLAVNFYKKIRKYAKVSKSVRVLDLFCGVGSIGLFLAKGAKFVWGVEMNNDIVDLSWENSQVNKIDNISFLTSDTKKFLNSQSMFYKGIDLLILNPPRSGLSNKIIRSILRLKPKTIIYSSCNPQALFKDLQGLNERYKLEFVEPFDFFPHTPHLEVLAFLKKV
jgi:23S rRNA (uracil-5-)-methyltransferase RumA